MVTLKAEQALLVFLPESFPEWRYFTTHLKKNLSREVRYFNRQFYPFHNEIESNLPDSIYKDAWIASQHFSFLQQLISPL